jgi:two-component system LytT family response regulator
MVQLSQINNIEGDGSRALLKNGVKLEVADRRRKDLVSHWKQYR